MGKIQDLTGQIFGRLTVISLDNVRNKDRKARWVCKCSCGNETILTSSILKRSKTPSCGCYNSERIIELNKSRKLPNNESGLNNLYYKYKRDAEKRGYEFQLTKEFFNEITQKDCNYCGSSPSSLRSISKSQKDGDKYCYNGIDRINNDLGYIEGNCTPCCGVCNIAKRSMTLDDFRNWVFRIYNHMYFRTQSTSFINKG